VAKRQQVTKASKPPKALKNVEALRHTDDKRLNIPTAEHQSVLEADQVARKEIRYPRNTDLDPQLVWRGKDYQDWSDLVVQAPPLYIQEKVHPKVLIDDLLRESKGTKAQGAASQIDLFADFNGVAEGADRTDFYQHDQNWTNRMILGDSLQAMASLAEREGLRGKVQCIYIDPPYGVKFNSNFQWSTTNRDVRDGNAGHITREPEQVKAFRDTWRDGINSYLTYLRDRLTVARDLLADSGSIFVQIGNENVHRLRSLLEEVFGEDNAVALLVVQKTTSATNITIPEICDFVLWFAKRKEAVKYRALYRTKSHADGGAHHYNLVGNVDGSVRVATEREREGAVTLDAGEDFVTLSDLQSAGMGREKGEGAASWFPVRLAGREFRPTEKTRWKTNEQGMARLILAGRVSIQKTTIRYKRRLSDFSVYALHNIWSDIGGAPDRRYVVETTPKILERCILMATDPGDLVLDPTCGSGTTATVAEQWGRRWITIDTSRVALALARARIMGARYSFYLLADSRDGQQKEAELARAAPSSQPVHGNIRQGFVYERVPHVTLKSIVDNTEIDVIWESWQTKLEPLRLSLNAALNKSWQDWEIPRDPDDTWPDAAKKFHSDWWQARVARQKEIDKSIGAKAEFEYLYDRPYSDPRTIRVAGPFTVESLSPHRTLGVDENDELIDPLQAKESGARSFEQMILENLHAAGVQQAHREGRITFEALAPWPGEMVCAEGRYREGEAEKRAAIFIGPEFGTVQRPDLVKAAREAGDAGFDVLIACAFNYEAHASEFSKLGRIPVLKARMNADLHMGGDLKPTGKGNLFVVFGEPDIEILHEGDGRLMVHVKGVDVFDPATGDVRSDGPDGIACWFIDTDYNEESFFVRHAYFLGQNDPYGALKTTLKAEIDADVWASLNSAISRPFPTPKSGRIAVKVINHLGDEVMKVFRIE
jgi:adenine-specific DNA-methyltransferase